MLGQAKAGGKSNETKALIKPRKAVAFDWHVHEYCNLIERT